MASSGSGSGNDHGDTDNAIVHDDSLLLGWRSVITDDLLYGIAFGMVSFIGFGMTIGQVLIHAIPSMCMHGHLSATIATLVFMLPIYAIPYVYDYSGASWTMLTIGITVYTVETACIFAFILALAFSRAYVTRPWTTWYERIRIWLPFILMAMIPVIMVVMNRSYYLLYWIIAIIALLCQRSAGAWFTDGYHHHMVRAVHHSFGGTRIRTTPPPSSSLSASATIWQQLVYHHMVATNASSSSSPLLPSLYMIIASYVGMPSFNKLDLMHDDNIIPRILLHLWVHLPPGLRDDDGTNRRTGIIEDGRYYQAVLSYRLGSNHHFTMRVPVRAVHHAARHVWTAAQRDYYLDFAACVHTQRARHHWRLIHQRLTGDTPAWLHVPYTTQGILAAMAASAAAVDVDHHDATEHQPLYLEGRVMSARVYRVPITITIQLRFQTWPCYGPLQPYYHFVKVEPRKCSCIIAHDDDDHDHDD